jgi:chemotaxis protein methyltransferase CheR
VPDPYKSTTFGFGTGAISGWMKVRSAVKRHVSFQQLNLSIPPYPWSGRFDIIFCRNVLIYFPRDVIETVIEGLYQAAAPGALLVIGHSESLQNIKVSWSYKQPSIFIKPERRR